VDVLRDLQNVSIRGGPDTFLPNVTCLSAIRRCWRVCPGRILVADDLAAERLVLQFGAISLPTRNYYVHPPDGRIDDSAASAFLQLVGDVDSG
jgi:hypothetical protein